MIFLHVASNHLLMIGVGAEEKNISIFSATELINDHSLISSNNFGSEENKYLEHFKQVAFVI